MEHKGNEVGSGVCFLDKKPTEIRMWSNLGGAVLLGDIVIGKCGSGVQTFALKDLRPKGYTDAYLRELLASGNVEIEFHQSGSRIRRAQFPPCLLPESVSTTRIVPLSVIEDLTR